MAPVCALSWVSRSTRRILDIPDGNIDKNPDEAAGFRQRTRIGAPQRSIPGLARCLISRLTVHIDKEFAMLVETACFSWCRTAQNPNR